MTHYDPFDYEMHAIRLLRTSGCATTPRCTSSRTGRGSAGSRRRTSKDRARGSDRLQHQGALPAVFFLFLAGNETTAQLIGNAINLPGTDLPLRKRLVERPADIPAALEEVLRVESPVQLDCRSTTRDVELHGQVIPKG